ncbi:MAG: STAS domain-containing protein [Acidobacteriota bacterium]|nr:STAS domain-containing protein [Acidobacteriota bacterium]
MPVPFSISTVFDDDLAIISLEGAVDAHTAPQFESAVQAAIDEQKNRIIVDCQKLTYISSAGLGVFMSFIEEVRDEGGDIKICGLTEKAKQPFEILGFDSLFDFCDDAAGAKSRFSESAAVGEA